MSKGLNMQHTTGSRDPYYHTRRHDGMRVRHRRGRVFLYFSLSRSKRRYLSQVGTGYSANDIERL